MTHSRWNSSHFFKQGLRGERSQTYPYMLRAKQGSIWFLAWHGRGIEPSTSSRGARSTTEPLLSHSWPTPHLLPFSSKLHGKPLKLLQCRIYTKIPLASSTFHHKQKPQEQHQTLMKKLDKARPACLPLTLVGTRHKVSDGCRVA